MSYSWGVKGLTGSLCVKIMFNAPDKRKRDIDNTLKPTLDAFQGAGVIGNDFQVDDLHIVRGPSLSGGRYEISISRLC